MEKYKSTVQNFLIQTNTDEDTCLLLVVNGHEYVPNSEAENKALSRFFDDWKRAGVTSFWLGVTANENCDFMKFNGYPLNYEGWATDEPRKGLIKHFSCSVLGVLQCENPDSRCSSDTKPQCAHLNILANEKNWKVQDCYAKEAFACQVKVGQKIHQGLFQHFDV